MASEKIVLLYEDGIIKTLNNVHIISWPLVDGDYEKVSGSKTPENITAQLVAMNVTVDDILKLKASGLL